MGHLRFAALLYFGVGVVFVVRAGDPAIELSEGQARPQPTPAAEAPVPPAPHQQGADNPSPGTRHRVLEAIGQLDEPAGAKSPAVPKKAKPIPREFEPKAFDAGDEEIVSLPKFEVRAQRLEKLQSTLDELARSERWEEKQTEISVLDELLNHPLFSIFGAENAEARAEKARRRIELMNIERLLQISLSTEEDKEERRRIREDIIYLRESRRRL